MRLHMPVTRQKINNHFQYGFWKYLLLVVIALAGWNLIYTSTRYQSPDNLKVEFYAEASGLTGEDVQTLADRIHEEVMPEMEEVTATLITYDETYGDMQLIVWVSAAQGDVYLLSDDRYASLVGSEALLDLKPYVDSGELDTSGLDLTGAYTTDAATGSTTLLGIPVESLPKLADYGLVSSKAKLCVLVNNGNDEYSIKFLNYLLTHMQADDTAAESADTAAAD